MKSTTRETLHNVFSAFFGVCMFYAVFAGAVTAVLYLVGFVLGGSVGQRLALLGAAIMKTGIPVSAIGALVGMLGFYVQGTHELTMAKKETGSK